MLLRDETDEQRDTALTRHLLLLLLLLQPS
jgi:hypothetical protein